MKKYIYDQYSLEFVREIEAIELPDDPGQFLPISFSTENAIPEVIPEGSVAVYNAQTDNWDIVQDNRNEEWYSKETGLRLNIRLGDTLESLNGTLIAKPEGFFKWENDNWVADQSTERQFLLKHLIIAVQAHLDAAAQAKGYDDIKSAALRAAFVGPFHDEGLLFAQWMDSCWQTCYQIKAEVEAGTRTMPTEQELINLLPILTLQ